MGMYYSQQRIMPNNLKKINKYDTIVWSMWYSNKLHKIFNFHALPLFSHLPNVKQNKTKMCGVFLIYNNVKLKKCEWDIYLWVIEYKIL